MKQIKLFKGAVKGEVRPRQRLATSRVVNSTYREITNYIKPEGVRYWCQGNFKITQFHAYSNYELIKPNFVL